jgi:hypothetical protein
MHRTAGISAIFLGAAKRTGASVAHIDAWTLAARGRA